MNTTDLNKIGEFGIVDFINSKFKNKRNSSIFGIVDDAAIIKSNKENIVISSDMLIEGVHFDLSYTPEELSSEIINTYKEAPYGDRSKLLNYFIQKRLKNLTESIGEF